MEPCTFVMSMCQLQGPEPGLSVLSWSWIALGRKHTFTGTTLCLRFSRSILQGDSSCKARMRGGVGCLSVKHSLGSSAAESSMHSYCRRNENRAESAYRNPGKSGCPTSRTDFQWKYDSGSPEAQVKLKQATLASPAALEEGVRLPAADLAKRSCANTQVQRKESRARGQTGNGTRMEVGVGLAQERREQDKLSGTAAESVSLVGYTVRLSAQA